MLIAPGKNRKFIVLSSVLKRLEVLCSQMETSFIVEKYASFEVIYIYFQQILGDKMKTSTKELWGGLFLLFLKVRIKRTLDLLLLRLDN